MKTQFWMGPILATTMAVTTIAAPMTAVAATHAPQSSQHRQAQKNTWRNLTIAGGVLAGLGLLTKNGTLTTVGIVGGLYSAYRYEQDRISQNSTRRQRAYLYSHNSVVYRGRRFNRKSEWKGGHEYYTFVEANPPRRQQNGHYDNGWHGNKNGQRGQWHDNGNGHGNNDGHGHGKSNGHDNGRGHGKGGDRGNGHGNGHGQGEDQGNGHGDGHGHN